MRTRNIYKHTKHRHIQGGVHNILDTRAGYFETDKATFPVWGGAFIRKTLQYIVNVLLWRFANSKICLVGPRGISQIGEFLQPAGPPGGGTGHFFREGGGGVPPWEGGAKVGWVWLAGWLVRHTTYPAGYPVSSPLVQDIRGGGVCQV